MLRLPFETCDEIGLIACIFEQQDIVICSILNIGIKRVLDNILDINQGHPMLSQNKSLIKSFYRFVYAYIKGVKLLFRKKSYLVKSGLIHTYKTGYPCTPDGKPLPWMNYNAITFLQERLNKDTRLFEFGSGFSTLFFASLAREVVSVEHVKEWFEKLKRDIPHNAKVIFCEKDYDGKYCRIMKEISGEFDIVVVDGRDRVNCITQACNCLSGKGVVILDDSQRERYKKGIEFLLSNGFRKIDFEGLKPTGTSWARTTIFYKDNNCLGL